MWRAIGFRGESDRMFDDFDNDELERAYHRGYEEGYRKGCKESGGSMRDNGYDGYGERRYRDSYGRFR